MLPRPDIVPTVHINADLLWMLTILAGTGVQAAVALGAGDPDDIELVHEAEKVLEEHAPAWCAANRAWWDQQLAHDRDNR